MTVGGVVDLDDPLLAGLERVPSETEKYRRQQRDGHRQA